MAVDEKNEVIFNQYDFDIRKIYRVRGAVVLDTDAGLKIMREYRMSGGKAEFENCIKQHIKDNGYYNVDLIQRNKEGNLISENQYGTRYVIKDYFPGEECSLKSQQDVLLAVRNLAGIHTVLYGVDFDVLNKKSNICDENVKDETEKDETEKHETEKDEFYINEPNALEDFRIIVPKKDIRNMLLNHSREIKRVQRYICSKKKRNEFEVLYLNTYDIFDGQGKAALEVMDSFDYQQELKKCEHCGVVYHGEYTQHNIVLFSREEQYEAASHTEQKYISADKDIALTGFDKAGIGLQIYDFYYLLRKTMEKNSWDKEIGTKMIDEYLWGRRVFGRDATKNELKTLHALLIFPDKLWKITDYYYNRSKAWISPRMGQKLIKLKEQEYFREKFIDTFAREYID